MNINQINQAADDRSQITENENFSEKIFNPQHLQTTRN